MCTEAEYHEQAQGNEGHAAGESRFHPVPCGQAFPQRRDPWPSMPTVFRNAAANWPAVKGWSFERLASEVDDTPVNVVRGDREQGVTTFSTCPLNRFVASLAAGIDPGYLKEFDLLGRFPKLAADVAVGDLLPRHHLRATHCWLGGAGTRTGLHHDLLDNLSVQILGSKQWTFVRPAAVRQQGAVSNKYDPWAVLASRPASELAREGRDSDFFIGHTRPGDVLFVPAGWWHEVLNLEPSLFVGGFHGAVLPVLARWAWVAARNGLHRAGLFRGQSCTCHPTA